MIASLRGALLAREVDSVTVEAGGVGYHVHVTANTMAGLPALGDEVLLHTRQIVREDALLLFGFAEPDERRVFDLLIGVNGVGPKLAVAALSGLAPASLAQALRDGNIAALVAVPGIGRRTAERLVVELRDKLEFLPGVRAAGGRKAPTPAAAEPFDDAIRALCNLGFPNSQATTVVRELAADMPEATLEAVVRAALARLGRAAALSARTS